MTPSCTTRSAAGRSPSGRPGARCASGGGGRLRGGERPQRRQGLLGGDDLEMPVEVEDDGTVKEIRCKEGQSVQEGDVLVVLD